MKRTKVAGIVCLKNGDLFVLDCGTRQLMNFNRRYEYRATRHLPVFCHSITGIEGKTVAITCGKNVLFYSMKNGGIESERKSFGLIGLGFHVVFNNGRFVIVCFSTSDGGVIQVTDGHGKNIRTISQESCNSILTQDTKLCIHEDCVYACVPETRRILGFSIHDGKLTVNVGLRWTPQDIISTRHFIIVLDEEQHSLGVYNRSGKFLATIWQGPRNRFKESVELMCFDRKRSSILLYSSLKGSLKAIQIEE